MFSRPYSLIVNRIEVSELLEGLSVFNSLVASAPVSSIYYSRPPGLLKIFETIWARQTFNNIELEIIAKINTHGFGMESRDQTAKNRSLVKLIS